MWALPRPPEGDIVSSGESVAFEEVNAGKAQHRFGIIGDAADTGTLGEPSATAGQSSQLGPVDGGHGQHGVGITVAMASEAQANDVEAAGARTTEAKAKAVEENAGEAKAAEAKDAKATAAKTMFSGTKAAVEGGNARKARRSSRGE